MSENIEDKVISFLNEKKKKEVSKSSSSELSASPGELDDFLSFHFTEEEKHLIINQVLIIEENDPYAPVNDNI